MVSGGEGFELCQRVGIYLVIRDIDFYLVLYQKIFHTFIDVRPKFGAAYTLYGQRLVKRLKHTIGISGRLVEFINRFI